MAETDNTKKYKEDLKKDDIDYVDLFNIAKEIYDENDENNKNEALEMFCSVAKNINDYKTIYFIGKTLYEEGYKIEAAECFQKAADGGNKKAIEEYAKMLENGDGINIDTEKAEEYYSKDNELLINKIKEKLEKQGYKIGKILGVGGEGTVFLASNSNEKNIVIKIPVVDKEREILSDAEIKNKEKINKYIDIAGNGFTKVLNNHKITINNKTYLIETYKKREMDLEKKLNGTIFGESKKDLSVIPIMAQLILSLKAVHLKGLILSDIKPENILINENDRVKFSDFGLTNFANYLKETKLCSGTEAYMANEVLKKYFTKDTYTNEKSDVYSIGIVFLEMFTQESIYDFLKKLNNNNDIDYNNAEELYGVKENLDEKITLEDIKLEGLFPGIDFDNENNSKQQELKEKILEILKSMLKSNYKERSTIFEIQEKFTNMLEYMQKNITKNNTNISIKNDLKVEDKELIKLGISNEIKVNEAAKKFKSKLEKSINKNDLSTEAKNCLRVLHNSIDENGNIEQMDYSTFYSNAAKLFIDKNKLEYLSILDKMDQFDHLRFINGKDRLENYDNLSLETAISINPEMIEHFFVLDLNSIENLELKVDCNNLMSKLNIYPGKKYEDLTLEEKNLLLEKYNKLSNEEKNNFKINYDEMDFEQKKNILHKWLNILFEHSCKNNDKFAIKFLLKNEHFKEIAKNENLFFNFLKNNDLNTIKVIFNNNINFLKDLPLEINKNFIENFKNFISKEIKIDIGIKNVENSIAWKLDNLLNENDNNILYKNFNSILESIKNIQEENLNNINLINLNNILLKAISLNLQNNIVNGI